MWDDFRSKFPDGGDYQLYFKAFKDENIGFSTPSVDDCKLCLDYKYHIAALGDNCHDSDICIEKKEHQEMHREAREEYKKAGDVDEVCFTADMQKVIVLHKTYN